MTTDHARIARIRSEHVLTTDVPDCPNCGEGPPWCDHSPVTFCASCLNDEGPCDALFLLGLAEGSGADQ